MATPPVTDMVLRPEFLATYNSASAAAASVLAETAWSGKVATPIEIVMGSCHGPDSAATAARSVSARMRASCLVRGAGRHEDGELLATDPCHQVPGPNVRGQHGRELDQDGVSGGVAGPVVDSLEMVDVQEQPRRDRNAARVARPSAPRWITCLMVQHNSVPVPGMRGRNPSRHVISVPCAVRVNSTTAW